LLPLFRHGAQGASRHHTPRPSTHPSNGNPRSTLRALAHRAIVAAGLGLLLTANAAGLASAHHHPAQDRVSTKFRVGQTVADYGLTLVAPARGGFVFGEVHYLDGTAEQLILETDQSGRVFASHLGNDRVAGALAKQGASSLTADPDDTNVQQRLASDDGMAVTTSSTECGSTSSYAYNWRIPSYKWALNTSTIPSFLRSRSNGDQAVIDQIKSAASNITGARNVCGRGDYISATHTYLGSTGRTNGISTSAGCTGGDGYSVVNFGYLPSGVLGMACAYGLSSGTAKEGDVRLNLKTPWETQLGWCSSETLIQAAMAHEFGHIFGLGHVYGSPQTMNPYVPNCSLAPTTLGLGDLLGFERKY
jgi:hypothetical protein